MLAIGYFSSGPAFSNVGGSFLWLAQVTYQLQESSSSKGSSFPVTWATASTPLSVIIDASKNAIISAASTNYSVTLSASDITFLSTTNY